MKLRENDKSRRPYLISLDWLSLRCSRTLWFQTDGTNQQGYTLINEVGHGSRNWREIRNVYDSEGVFIGTVTFNPTSKNIDPDMVVFKADNALLYESDGVPRIMAAVIGLGLEFRSIARIDIACDFNEFYNGLLPRNFMASLFQRKYVKVGLNKAFAVVDFGYYATDKEGSLAVFNRMPDFEKSKGYREWEDAWIKERNAEIEPTGLPLITKEALKKYEVLPTSSARIDALTWGKTGRAIQVQMYNKTKELQEVKMKRYIVEAWKEAGLDISRDVWRVEMRIQLQGKQLVNLTTGESFTLSTIDILTAEQIQELYKSYAEKYFKFYINDGHAKVQNCKQLQLFSWCEPAICRPKRVGRGSPTKYILSLANRLQAMGYEAKQEGNEDVANAAAVMVDVFVRAYGLSKMSDEDIALHEFDTGVSRRLTMPLRIDASLHSSSTKSDEIILRAIREARSIKQGLLDIKHAPPIEVDWDALEEHIRRNVQKMVDPIEYRVDNY